MLTMNGSQELKDEARMHRANALVAQATGRMALAELSWDLAIGCGEEAFGPTSAWMAKALQRAAEVYRSVGRLEDAIEACERVVVILSRDLHPDDPKIVVAYRLLAEVKHGHAMAV